VINISGEARSSEGIHITIEGRNFSKVGSCGWQLRSIERSIYDNRKNPLKIRGRGRNTTIKITAFCGCLIFGC